MKNISLCMILLLNHSSCVSSLEDEVKINSSLRADTPYFKEYEKNSRQAKVIGTFEHKFTIGATYLTASMKSAMQERHQRLMDRNDLSFLSEDQNHPTHFIVSIYSPNDDLMQLSDNKLWTISLRNGEQSSSPVRVQRLREKILLEAFFEHATAWSREFIVSFDKPTEPGVLTLASVDGRIEFDFTSSEP